MLAKIVYPNKKKNNRIDEWFAIDKVQHFMYSAFVSLGTQYVLVNKIQMDENDALPLSSLLSFSAGLLKEINDNRSKNGFFSKKIWLQIVLGYYSLV